MERNNNKSNQNQKNFQIINNNIDWITLLETYLISEMLQYNIPQLKITQGQKQTTEIPKIQENLPYQEILQFIESKNYEQLDWYRNRDGQLGDCMCHLRALEFVLRKLFPNEGFQNNHQKLLNFVRLKYGADTQEEDSNIPGLKEVKFQLPDKTFGHLKYLKNFNESLRKIFQNPDSQNTGGKGISQQKRYFQRSMRTNYLKQMYDFFMNYCNMDENLFEYLEYDPQYHTKFPQSYPCISFTDSYIFLLQQIQIRNLRSVVLLLDFKYQQNQVQLTNAQMFRLNGNLEEFQDKDDIVVFQMYTCNLDSEEQIQERNFIQLNYGQFSKRVKQISLTHEQYPNHIQNFEKLKQEDQIQKLREQYANDQELISLFDEALENHIGFQQIRKITDDKTKIRLNMEHVFSKSFSQVKEKLQYLKKF